MKIKLILFVCFVATLNACQKDATKPISANINSELAKTQELKIGQHYAGGIIFYLTTDKKHGIVAAAADINTDGIRWGYGINYFDFTGATDTAFGKGKRNTKKIITTQGTTITSDYAAHACAKYKEGGFTDWFLPSQNELKMLYANKDAIGGFGAGAYWSSSELPSTASLAICVNFNSGAVDWVNKNTWFRVRPIRYF